VRVVLPEDALFGDRWSMFDPLPTQLQLLSDKTLTDRASSSAMGCRCLEFRVIGEGVFRLQLVRVCGCERPDRESANFDVHIKVDSP